MHRSGTQNQTSRQVSAGRQQAGTQAGPMAEAVAGGAGECRYGRTQSRKLVQCAGNGRSGDASSIYTRQAVFEAYGALKAAAQASRRRVRLGRRRREGPETQAGDNLLRGEQAAAGTHGVREVPMAQAGNCRKRKNLAGDLRQAGRLQAGEVVRRQKEECTAPGRPSNEVVAGRQAEKSRQRNPGGNHPEQAGKQVQVQAEQAGRLQAGEQVTHKRQVRQQQAERR